MQFLNRGALVIQPGMETPAGSTGNCEALLRITKASAIRITQGSHNVRYQSYLSNLLPSIFPLPR